MRCAFRMFETSWNRVAPSHGGGHIGSWGWSPSIKVLSDLMAGAVPFSVPGMDSVPQHR